ncbi:hypothetical protein MGH68_15310 [Erysipelothrix sp. D19-032]
MFKTINHYFQIIVGVGLVSFAINQFLAPHDIAKQAERVGLRFFSIMLWIGKYHKLSLRLMSLC